MRRPHFKITDHADGKSFVHTRVELFYRQFLDDLDVDYANDEDRFDAHIKSIIWGVLYIEGLVNYKLYEFTERKISDRTLIDQYWELTKQARMQDKLDLIFSSDNVKRPWLKEVRKKFLKMVEERNRLVHFKETPTPIKLPALVTKLGLNARANAWAEHTPYPRIVAELLATDLSVRFETFRALGDALEHVRTGN